MTQPFAAEAARCRAAQLGWATQPVRDRLRIVREFRSLLVEHADELTAAVEADVGRVPGEVVATDLLPTAAACKFLLSDAERILKPRRAGRPPLWLIGCRDTIHRRPHGVVGLIGTWNYPIFLNAVPIAQAIVAGNGVLWKPSEYAARSAAVLQRLFVQAGLPGDLLQLLPARREAGPQLAEADVDFIHFTGSDNVGRKLAAKLGERLIPSVMELSGVDAVIVRSDADVKLAARSAWYGATLNGGQTCMACRRALVQRDVYDKFVTELRPLVEAAPASRLVTAGQYSQVDRLLDDAAGTAYVDHVSGQRRADGANSERWVTPTVFLNANHEMTICNEASFAPLLAVIPYIDESEAVKMHASNPFGLAAAVFTADQTAADQLADQLKVGAVVVNDVIVPTAHPGTPFGGRGASGWGSTQGEEGLLAMTVPQVVTHRSGKFRPHVDGGLNHDPAMFDVARGFLRFSHGRTLGDRLRGLRQLVSGMVRSKR